MCVYHQQHHVLQGHPVQVSCWLDLGGLPVPVSPLVFLSRSWIRPCLQHDNQFPPSSLQGADGTAGSEGFQGRLGLQRQDSLGPLGPLGPRSPSAVSVPGWQGQRREAGSRVWAGTAPGRVRSPCCQGGPCWPCPLHALLGTRLVCQIGLGQGMFKLGARPRTSPVAEVPRNELPGRG